VTHT